MTTSSHDDDHSETLDDRGRVLLVDDEDDFRKGLARRLELRGYEVTEVDNGEKAVEALRLHRPEVVVLDRKMPGMQGEETLAELKKISPQVQVVILTGHGTIDSAKEAGRRQAFAYLQKPCELEALVDTIEKARRERRYALARDEVPQVSSRSIGAFLWGMQGYRPGIILLGAALFAAFLFVPIPASLRGILESTRSDDRAADPIAGYARYSELREGETVAAHYLRYAHRDHEEGTEPAREVETAGRAGLIMIGILVVCALFWASGALPIGFTAMLVAVLMYLFHVFPPDTVAKAFAKDAVIFILGVLAFSVAVSKTGLDRRIGLVLLGTSRSIGAFLFIFCPLVAVSAAFLSEHALVAFIAPLLMVVYVAAVGAARVTRDRALAVTLLLAFNFAANQGGPGSPAAGGRNAIMVGILGDYGVAPTFGQWVAYGIPFVPVMALVIALYFWLVVARKRKVPKVDVASMVSKESKKLGRMTWKEWATLAVLLLVVTLWITSSDVLGMGGPVLIGLLLLAVLGLVTWRDVSKIQWDVVALYGSASAMGVGLAITGAALWMAQSFLALLPNSLSSGEGLCVAVSFITAIMTNFMSDGATVSAVGPIAVPMATASGTHPWMIGFAVAFASSFANCLVVGTPNNAIIFALARDPETGEQLVRLSDFLKHGAAVTLLSLVVLWGWTFYGYWRWIGF